MTEPIDFSPPDPGDATIQEQLQRAAKDLWTMVEESGEDYIVLMDRRRLYARVQQEADGAFSVRWQDEVGGWVPHGRTYRNLREAAFHAYQGPH